MNTFCRQLLIASLASALVYGCGREDSAVSTPETKVDPPSVYMKDQAFRAKLKTQREARGELVATREGLIDKARAMYEAKAAAMPGADEAAVVAALETDPEWCSLKKKIEDLHAAYEESRAQTLKTVRERIAVPLDPISK